jgi:hypothetical protein
MPDERLQRNGQHSNVIEACYLTTGYPFGGKLDKKGRGKGDTALTKENERPEACRAHMEMVEKTARLEEKLVSFAEGFKHMGDSLNRLTDSWFKEYSKRVPLWTLIGFTFMSGLVFALLGGIVTFFLMGRGSP